MVRSPPDAPHGAALKAPAAIVDATPNAAAVAVVSGIGRCRPGGIYSLVEAVDLVSQTIAHCRTAGIGRLLFDATGMTGFPVPTLVERFLMVEDWALESAGTVIVAMVAHDEYIHPQRFGVKVAERFGLVCDVFTAPDEALQWLADDRRPDA